MAPQLKQDNLPGPSGWFTFLYYFSTTILVVALIGSRSAQLPVTISALNQYGLGIATLAGLLGVAFNRTTQHEVPFKKKAKFQQNFEQLLGELGYEADTDAMARQPEEGLQFAIYRKTGPSRLLTGRVFLLWEKKSVHIISRAANVRMLKQRLENQGKT